MLRSAIKFPFVLVALSSALFGTTVTLSSPTNGSSLSSPVRISASATSKVGIASWKVYVDKIVVYQAGAQASIGVDLPVTSGTHTLLTRAYDNAGQSASKQVTINVLPANQDLVSVSISPTSATLNGGENQQFTASVIGTMNTQVIWSVNGVAGGNSNVGTITAEGLYTAPGCTAGTRVITATSVFDASASSSASVTLLASSNSPAGHYFVSPSGNDANDGTNCRPWATIQKAAGVVKAGETVHVAPGTYGGQIVTSASGTENARIRYVSDVKWAAKIVANGLYTDIWTNRGSYVTIEGFDISGNASSTYGIRNQGNFGQFIGNHVHHIPATGCPTRGGAGLYVGTYTAQGNEMIANVVHDIGDPTVLCNRVHGLYHANRGGRVVNNITYRNQGWGIHLYQGATDVTVANNLVFQNGRGGMTFSADGAAGYLCDNLIVTNNIVVYNGFSWSSSPAVRENESTGMNNLYANNLLYGNKTNTISLLNGTTAQNTIVADPEFMNYQPDGTGDYHLKSTSPAIDAGTLQGAPEMDADWGTRPIGSGYDIGVYEYGSTAGAWPW